MKFFASFKTLSLVMVMLASIAVSGCSDPEMPKISHHPLDPNEEMNRYLFEVHQFVDWTVLEPMGYTFQHGLPEPVRDRAHDFLKHWYSPVVFLNDFFQGDWDKMARTFGRFLVNSTIGLLGLVDIAGEAGLPYEHNDFGRSLAHWGSDMGPYVVSPLTGPSSVRGMTGFFVDLVIDPVGWFLFFQDRPYGAVRYAGTIADRRAATLELTDELKKSSIDYYAVARSAYLQNRSFTKGDKENLAKVARYVEGEGSDEKFSDPWEKFAEEEEREEQEAAEATLKKEQRKSRNQKKTMKKLLKK